MSDVADRLCETLYPGGHGEERECVLPFGHKGAHQYAVIPDWTPRCPHCGEPSLGTLYASTFHEHSCSNAHTWRVY